MKPTHPPCTLKHLYVTYMISHCVNSCCSIALTNGNKKSICVQYRCISPDIFILHLVEHRDAGLRATESALAYKGT